MRWKPYNAYENVLIDKKLSYARRIVTIIVVIMIIIAAVVQKQKKTRMIQTRITLPAINICHLK